MLAAAAAAILAAGPAGAHDVYLMNSNHTDYNWNATAAQYDAAMLADLDYYLLQIAATAGNPPEEQSRYVPDCWWWLHLYQEHRSPAQFRQLLAQPVTETGTQISASPIIVKQHQANRLA